jgi:hypothetical protein
MIKINRITKPSFKQYQDAVRFTAEQWKEINPSDCRERYEALLRLRFELILAQEEDKIQGTCFVLPDKFSGPSAEHRFVWLFGMIVCPAAKNLGALMLFKIMSWYPAILCIGVTEEAAKLYQALRWKKYGEVWRCVHPIRLTDMLEHYKNRLPDSLKINLLKAGGLVYELLMFIIELLLRPACWVKKVRFSTHEQIINNKLNIISRYRKIYFIIGEDKAVAAVDVDGIGRIVRDDFVGGKRFLAHLKLWRNLINHGIIYCEYIATSKKDMRQALIYGYLPINMPIYYKDKNNILTTYFNNIQNKKFTFLSTDKLL